MEEDLIIEIWDTFKEYVPEKNRDNAASHFVDFLIGRDVEMSVIESLSGFDPHLDTAIETVLDEENGYVDDEDEDADWDRYDDDEDH
jgi:hypothetical protein